MAAESICDGCGKRQPMENNGRAWFKPQDWFERTPMEGKNKGKILTACSRPCIDRINEKDDAPRGVLPI